MSKKFNKVIIATGGTGGYIFPAYSLANHFINQKVNVRIISDKRGMKYLKNYNNLKISLIYSKTIFTKNIFKLIFSLFTIIYSILRSLVILLTDRPNLVFGMGGYSSFPVCVAAKILGIPFIIYENNLQIGKANKYLLPFAKKIFVSNIELEGISNIYKNKICTVGNIIRKEIIDFNPSININKNSSILRILILGGSQAAKTFAEKLPEIFKRCSDTNIPIKIYQQCLPEQNKFLTSFYNDLNIDFQIFNFTNNILEYFSLINLAITRSGSSMLAELTNSKIPFISIPLPTSADNHQLKNAIYYEKKGYSYLIEEKDLSTKLFKLIKIFHEDKFLLEKIKIKQAEYSDKSVFIKIDKEIENIINEKY